MKIDPKISEADFKDMVISVAKRYGGLMDLEQQVALLARMVQLLQELFKSDDYLGKDEVIRHLRWAS